MNWNQLLFLVTSSYLMCAVIQHKTYYNALFLLFAFVCVCVFQQAAKMANYAKYQRLCDFLFIVFSVAFFITRLVIYPIW